MFKRMTDATRTAFHSWIKFKPIEINKFISYSQISVTKKDKICSVAFHSPCLQYQTRRRIYYVLLFSTAGMCTITTSRDTINTAVKRKWKKWTEEYLDIWKRQSPTETSAQHQTPTIQKTRIKSLHNRIINIALQPLDFLSRNEQKTLHGIAFYCSHRIPKNSHLWAHPIGLISGVYTVRWLPTWNKPQSPPDDESPYRSTCLNKKKKKLYCRRTCYETW